MYNIGMDFLRELEELRLKTPRLYNINIAGENSQYCTHADKNKNCYMVFAINYSQDCYYGGLVVDSRDCADCNYCEKSELCYECLDVQNCYNCNFSQDLKNCNDCTFCYDCVGCKNCFGCAGLRQKEYCFFNERLSKEEYKKRLAEFDFKNPQSIVRAREKFEEVLKKTPRRAVHSLQSENCTGDYIVSSKNCFFCFDTHDSQDCFYLQDCWRTKDSSDCTFSDGTELCYECFSIGLGCYNCNYSNYIRGSSDCEYCELIFSCKDCFGCVGLQNKQYYILNKPYSREEYFKKVSEIKAQMRSDGSYGKQLPSTYKFEDTAAYK